MPAPKPQKDPEPKPAAVPPGSKAAFDQHRGEAEALPASEVVPWYGEPELIRANVQKGAKAVLAERAAVDAEMKHAPWGQVEAAPSLALAATYAFSEAARTVDANPRPYKLVYEAVRGGREGLLAAAALLVRQGKVDPKQVAAVREGSGAHDLAEDALALCGLVDAAGAAGDGLFPAAERAHVRAEADDLLARLRPGRRKGDRAKQGEAKRAADLRDRIFTLLLRAYDQTWRLGAVRWGRAVGRHVPGLNQQRIAG